MPVRPATPDDASEVVRLAALMYGSIGHDVTDPDWLAAAHASLASRLGDDLAVFVVDHPDGTGLVASGAGTVSTRLPSPNNVTGRVGYIQWIATNADARRRGHARAVMNALLAWYATQCVQLVELHATADGEPLYRDLGFTDGPHAALRRR